jgi:hypothetical protein
VKIVKILEAISYRIIIQTVTSDNSLMKI